MQKYSVVTTVFNDEKNIMGLIKNIEEQTFLPEEFIIVDGGSSDETVKRVLEYKRDAKINIRLFYGERLNIAAGFNKGIKEAKCDYVGIVACGNYYVHNFFQKLGEKFVNDKELYVSYGAIQGKSESKWGKYYCDLFLGKKNLHLESFPTNHGNLCRKKLFHEMGYFYEKFFYAGEDREFFIKILTKGYKVCGNEEIIIQWEVPSTIKALIKQQIGYTISDMEMYGNDILFSIYKGRIKYALGIVVMLFLLSLRGTRIFGLLALGLYLYKNMLNLKKGIEYVYYYNIVQIVPVLIMIKNWRYFKRKNKIENLVERY